jgi:hypothetical protein
LFFPIFAVNSVQNPPQEQFKDKVRKTIKIVKRRYVALLCMLMSACHVPQTKNTEIHSVPDAMESAGAEGKKERPEAPKWLSYDQFSNWKPEEVATALKGRWSWYYSTGSWGKTDTTSYRDWEIEFSPTGHIYFYCEGQKVPLSFVWMGIKNKTGTFELDFKPDLTTAEPEGPRVEASGIGIRGMIGLSEELNYVSFSNGLEVDAGPLSCFKRKGEGLGVISPPTKH